MRRVSVALIGSALIVAVAILTPATRLLAEDTTDETVETEGQTTVGDVPAATAPAKRLHTIPEDNMGAATSTGPNGPVIRALLKARPNEDLVICVAGCFTGRDRVVYAQPADPHPVAQQPVAMQATPAPADAHVSAVAPASMPAKGAAVATQAAKSNDPKSPQIINSAAGESHGKVEPSMSQPAANNTDGSEAAPSANGELSGSEGSAAPSSEGTN